MGFTQIVTLFILILVYDDHRKFVSAVEKKSTDTSTTQNSEATSTYGSYSGLLDFDMQVAGHGSKLGNGKGMFKDPEGNLLKGGINKREVMFYETLQTSEDPILKELREYVPRYYGVKTIKAEDEDKAYDYLCLEDQTRGFTLTSVMDIKMGEQFWEPGESLAKIRERQSKYTAMREHYGFSIPGVTYYDIDSEKIQKYERPFTYTITPKLSIQVLYDFVNRQLGLEYGLVSRILDELRKIYSWFRRQRHYKFYGSSILIVYDGASLKRKEPIVHVSMIDFAHAVPNAENERERDENYLRGLRNLIGLLENLSTAVRKYTNILDEPGASYRSPTMNDDEQERSFHVSVPEGWHPFDQIAGRVINKRGKKLGFLKDSQGNLWKPDPHQEEVDFYETLSKTQDPILLELKQYVPMYFGVKTMEIEKETVRFIHLENILNDLEVPCRIDVKMGVKRRPHWAPPKPADRLYKYKAMLATWKFAIPGYKCYRIPLTADAEPEKKSRKSTYHMQPDEAIRTLYDFVNGEWGIRCGLVDSLLDELRKIESWFERQRHYRFYDSSVFLTYDAQRLDDFAKGYLTESDCRSLEVPVKVRMIDFGNTFPDTEDEPDENYLEALRNLMSIFDNFAKNKFDPNSPSTSAGHRQQT